MSDQILISVKTADLLDVTLDWAVAKAEGLRIDKDPMGGENFIVFPDSKSPDWVWLNHYDPSDNWAIAGPIIDRENIDTGSSGVMGGGFSATKWEQKLSVTIANQPVAKINFAPTRLVAAMRCYIKAKLGDQIDVPAELVTQRLTSKAKP